MRWLKSFGKELYKNKTLYLMIVPALVFVVLFNYVPLYGLQIAFRNFNVVDGISHSPFVGLKNFEFYFKSMYFGQTTWNTLYLNALFILFDVVFQVGVAVLLSEVGRRRQKAYQTAMFFPYFISWIVVQAFLTGLLSERFGVVNRMLAGAGMETVAWFAEPSVWPVILVIAHVWKNLGYGSVIYLAKIIGIDQEIYEAAKIDGANRFQEIFRITLPLLRPAIVLLVLIAIGNIFRGDFSMIYAFVGEQGILYPTTDVIDTYVYRAMRINSQYGMAAAVGLYQSVMGFVLVMASNWLVKRRDPDSAMF